MAVARALVRTPELAIRSLGGVLVTLEGQIVHLAFPPPVNIIARPAPIKTAGIGLSRIVTPRFLRNAPALALDPRKGHRNLTRRQLVLEIIRVSESSAREHRPQVRVLDVGAM